MIKGAPSLNVFSSLMRCFVAMLCCANAKGMEDELEEMRKSSRCELFRKMSCKNVLYCQIELFSVVRLRQMFGVSRRFEMLLW